MQLSAVRFSAIVFLRNSSNVLAGGAAAIIAESEEKPEAGVVVKSLETIEGGLAGLGAGIAG